MGWLGPGGHHTAIDLLEDLDLGPAERDPLADQFDVARLIEHDVDPEPLVARSGPSPGSSEVVRNDPLTPGDVTSDEANSDDTSADDAGDAAPTQEDDVSPTPLSPFAELRGQPGVVYATDFTELSDVEWEIYDSPGHAGLGLRRPSAITLEPDDEAEGGSVLTITARTGTEGDEAGQLVSGGMALRLPLVYGTYTFRIRVDPDPAQVTSGVAILWPWSNRWPEDGELDMFETWVNRTTRAPVESNIHYLDPLAEPPFVDTDDRLFSVVHSSVDGSVWHTYRFDWRADGLSMAIDDGPMRLLTDDPLHIPDWLMVPTFQLDAFPAPGGTREGAALEVPVALEVDWLVIEE